MNELSVQLNQFAFAGFIKRERVESVRDSLDAAILILEAKEEELSATTKFSQGAYRTVLHARKYLERQRFAVVETEQVA